MTFCTIITSSHLKYAQVLYESLRKFIPHVQLNILVVDGTAEFLMQHSTEYFILNSRDSIFFDIGDKIEKKYYASNMDHYRWSMKPVWICHLLEQGYEKVLYIDSDIYFYQDPTFLINKLNNMNVLLSPHWRDSDIASDFDNFVRNYTHGLFNGGFVACNAASKEAMLWWAHSCASRCKIEPKKGFYVDQSYLSMFPVLFDKVEIVKHKGCNVANWNRKECRRTSRDGNILINDEFPIIFIHMTPHTIKGILNGEDTLLYPYLKEYNNALKTIDPKIDLFMQFAPKKRRIWGR